MQALTLCVVLELARPVHAVVEGYVSRKITQGGDEMEMEASFKCITAYLATEHPCPSGGWHTERFHPALSCVSHTKLSFFQGVPRDVIKFVRAIAHQVGAGWQRASGPDGDCWVHPFWEDGVLWVEQMPDCTLIGLEQIRTCLFLLLI